MKYSKCWYSPYLPKIQFGLSELANKCLSLFVINSSDDLQKLVFLLLKHEIENS